jgi:hypothetical protein
MRKPDTEQLYHAVKMSNLLTLTKRGRTIRPYAPRASYGRGRWVTLHLPTGLLAHLTKYANLEGMSQNELLATLLRDGLFCYLTGYTRFLKALKAVAP